MVKPAYHIALTPVEKRLIAELAAIQSQIEWLMHLTVGHLLEVEAPTARAILGSTKLSANADIWVRVVRERHPYEEAILWGEWCYAEMEVQARHRNDFLHTLYGFEDDGDALNPIYFQWGHRGWDGARALPRMAVRVKNAAKAPLKDLSKIVDRAAYLSCAVAHVEWSSDIKNDGSPWLRRLGGRYPPPRGEWGPHKAIAQSPPPQSFRG